MKLCDKCFTMLEGNPIYCPECGASVDEGPAAEGSDALVYPDIARANLMRMRGAWADAERVCLSILKRFPNNATAHILLGDIHTDRGRGDQALQWYELASDLSPENPSLQAKLRRAGEAVRELESARASSGLEVAPAGRGMAVFYASVVVMVFSVGGLAFWFAPWRAGRADAQAWDEIATPVSVGGMAPARSVEPAGETGSDSDPEPRDGGSTTGDGAAEDGLEENGSKRDAQPPSTMSSHESGLMKAVANRLGESGARLLALQFDPRTDRVIVTIQAHPEGNAETDLVECAAVGAAVLESEAAAGLVHVRILDTVRRALLFVGTVKRTSIQSATSPPGSPEWAREVVSDLYKPGE
ncbi:MAG: hypothetical protein IH851_06560 [Armatimonadetes bacterium]|nr:hypothetical protein [Armatimonadota bacterium]